MAGKCMIYKDGTGFTLRFGARPIASVTTMAFLILRAGGVSGQDEEPPPLGFTDVAELTFVLTSGNATSSTLGLANTAHYRWENALVQLATGAVRAESGIETRSPAFRIAMHLLRARAGRGRMKRPADSSQISDSLIRFKRM